MKSLAMHLLAVRKTITQRLVFGLSFLLLLSFQPAVCFAQPESTPLKQAHAHNDYLHDRPLLDAVENRFSSVEADVFLVDGDLLVAHTIFGLDKSRTLQNLYLRPLQKMVSANSGNVYKNVSTEFILLIDIKNKGAETYRVLHDVLKQYPEVFSHVVDGKLQKKAVRAIISGDRAIEVIENTSPRFSGIDGRLSDLDTKMPNHLMPLISDNWNRHFKWRGIGPISKEEQSRLEGFVARAHSAGRRIRFWASPDNQSAWAVQREAGVDLINTDNLSGLRGFLDRSRRENRGSKSSLPE